MFTEFFSVDFLLALNNGWDFLLGEAQTQTDCLPRYARLCRGSWFMFGTKQISWLFSTLFLILCTGWTMQLPIESKQRALTHHWCNKKKAKKRTIRTEKKNRLTKTELKKTPEEEAKATNKKNWHTKFPLKTHRVPSMFVTFVLHSSHLPFRSVDSSAYICTKWKFSDLY